MDEKRVPGDLPGSERPDPAVNPQRKRKKSVAAAVFEHLAADIVFGRGKRFVRSVLGAVSFKERHDLVNVRVADRLKHRIGILAAELIEMIRQKEYSLLLTDLNMPEISGFELLELLRSSNVGNSKSIPIVVTTASGSCSKEELIGRGFAGCLFKPFSISELMEITDKCALSSILDEKPDFSTLLSYGNESVMLDKLIAETEKEMQAVKDAEQRKDLQELDTLTHHLRSSWQILRADQPLRELYAQLHGSATPDDEAICKAVTGCAG